MEKNVELHLNEIQQRLTQSNAELEPEERCWVEGRLEFFPPLSEIQEPKVPRGGSVL